MVTPSAGEVVLVPFPFQTCPSRKFVPRCAWQTPGEETGFSVKSPAVRTGIHEPYPLTTAILLQGPEDCELCPTRQAVHCKQCFACCICG